MKEPSSFILHQKGSVIVMKESVPDIELDSKALLDNMGNIQGEIAKLEQTLKQAKDVIPRCETNIAKNTEMLKKLSKFQEWAENIQLSKIKNIISEIKDEVYNRVVAEYVFDKTLTPEQNDLQKFMYYQKYLSTHKKIADEINNGMMKEYFYEHPIFDNPWKPLEPTV